MHDELVKRLRSRAVNLKEKFSRNAELLSELMQAADVIEELSQLTDAIPRVCECCIGCEVESGGCDHAFVLSPKRAKEYLSKSRWIPVTERLPKVERKSYWICTDNSYQCKCRWTNNRFGIGESDKWGWNIFDVPQYQKVVAWMSLPRPYEPPKEET